jgi:hypothetical protein
MMAGRYAHAKQFNRHRRQLRILRTRLGRLIRDIRRKIAGHADLEAAFAWPLSRADQIRSQQQRQRGWKLYSFHAPEVESRSRMAEDDFARRPPRATPDLRNPTSRQTSFLTGDFRVQNGKTSKNHHSSEPVSF